MTVVRVMLGYFHPWPNDAGFYTALAGGHYREAGLHVELAVVDPLRGDALEYLARGEADFAVCPTNRLLARRERGQRLRGIAAVNDRAMETVQTVTDTAITRPRELEGRRIALNPTRRGIAMVRHLVRRDGGDPDALIAVDSGVRELSVDDIAAGEVDATFGGYWAWDAPVRLARARAPGRLAGGGDQWVALSQLPPGGAGVDARRQPRARPRLPGGERRRLSRGGLRPGEDAGAARAGHRLLPPRGPQTLTGAGLTDVDARGTLGRAARGAARALRAVARGQSCDRLLGGMARGGQQRIPAGLPA